MSAKIITVFNQKGGVGKTVTSMLMAATIARKHKKRVLVVDMDNQGTSVRWASNAPDNRPFPATVISLEKMRGKVHRELRNLVDNYDFILVDCPPGLDESAAASSTLLVSDIALIPLVLAPADLWAVVGAKALVETAQDQNQQLQGRLLPNMAPSKKRITNIAQATLDALAEDVTLPITKNWLSNRTVYRECQALGCSIQDLPRSKGGIAEVEAVTAELLALLK